VAHESEFLVLVSVFTVLFGGGIALVWPKNRTIGAVMIVVSVTGFIALYFFWPEVPAATRHIYPTVSIHQHSEGLNSPNIVGNNNPVTISVPAPRRFDPLRLRKALATFRVPVSVAIWNDGNTEAGQFMNELATATRGTTWRSVGGGLKVGDPSFYPHACTIEANEPPLSGADKAAAAAEFLRLQLKKNFGIDCQFTPAGSPPFPPNFLRVKIAAQS
jgi:hypothetical protein